ncbi:MAG: hypothetical protein AMS24_03825 [Chlamydiae bacterium SM23_39]|nr:MAG: hypothetical protein AMS24_03825 [Chlamydiae bacterium SM23_39]
MGRISRLILDATTNHVAEQEQFLEQLKKEVKETKNKITHYYEEIASQTRKKQTNYTLGSVTGFLPILNFVIPNETIKKIIKMICSSTKNFPEILNTNNDAAISLYTGKRSIEEFALRSNAEDLSRILNEISKISELALQLIRADNS